jgi:hypothetical protein
MDLKIPPTGLMFIKIFGFITIKFTACTIEYNNNFATKYTDSRQLYFPPSV